MERQVSRAIIQTPYYGSRGLEIGVIVALEHHRGSYRYILPGGAVNHGESPEAALTREVKEELGLTVRGHLQQYADYSSNNQRTRIYIVTEVEPADKLWLDLKELKGIGVYGVGSSQIPPHLMFDHVRSLGQRFFNSGDPNIRRWARVPTQNIPRLSGLLKRSDQTPGGILTWEEQRQNWGRW